MRKRESWIVGLMVGLLGVVSPAEAAEFTPLGPLSRVYAVAGDGSRVAGYTPTGEAGFWSQSTGWNGFGFNGYAYAVSGDGKTIVGFSGSSSGTFFGNRAYRWDEAIGITQLPRFSTNDPGNQALAVSADGVTVAGAEELPSPPSAVRYVFRETLAGGMVSMQNVPGVLPSSEAHGVSGDGSKIVGTDANSRGWIWEASTNSVTPLTPGISNGIGLGFTPLAISADGRVIVGNRLATGDFAAGMWTADNGLVSLNAPKDGSGNPEARDVSWDGSIITGYYYLGGAQTAFTWDKDHGVRNLKSVLTNDFGLNLTGWRLAAAFVSDDGTTYGGFGFNPQNQIEGWVVAGIPEPTTLALLALGSTGLLRRRRKC